MRGTPPPEKVDGSSPHMRGTLLELERRFGGERFIPAHAGNTRGRRGRCSRSAVHPRTCGEHSVDSIGNGWRTGSSPHMRGTPGRLSGPLRGARFIPAHAGNTSGTCDEDSAATVHPRTCGEHDTQEPPHSTNDGSSPHMRGTPSQRSIRPVCRRFIPAHAGNTVD